MAMLTGVEIMTAMEEWRLRQLDITLPTISISILTARDTVTEIHRARTILRRGITALPRQHRITDLDVTIGVDRGHLVPLRGKGTIIFIIEGVAVGA